MSDDRSKDKSFNQVSAAMDRMSAAARDMLPPVPVPEFDLVMLVNFAAIGIDATFLATCKDDEQRAHFRDQINLGFSHLARTLAEECRGEHDPMTALVNVAGAVTQIIHDRYERLLAGGVGNQEDDGEEGTPT